MRTLLLTLLFVAAAAQRCAAQDFMRPTTLPLPPAGCCESPCDCSQPPCLKTICIPQPEIVKTTRPIYDVNLKSYCLPKCPLGLSWLWGGGCGCEKDHCCDCGHPHVRHVLMKRFVTEEHEACKCVPVCVPTCP